MNNRKYKNTLLIINLLLATCCISEVNAQYNPEIFGKQRVQYRTFSWKYYDGSNFRIYHYDRAGRELARFVVEQVERDIVAIEKRLGGLFPERINVILYNNFDDFDQSNIGLERPSQFSNNNHAGKVDVVGDKLAVYFNGNHNHLKEQLRRGMAQIVMERMMFGENFREIVKNMVLLDLPRWATDGYVDYIVKGWTSEDENEWKNMVLREDITSKNFIQVSTDYPRLVGKAVWKYIETQYGENSIRNLLYMTQVKSGLNAAMKLTVGQDLKTFYVSFIDFYKQHYTQELTRYDAITYDEKLAGIPAAKSNERISRVFVSPKGKDIAYVIHRDGEYEVVLEKTNLKDGERTQGKILKSGVLNYEDKGDPDYPIVAWSNTGFRLGIIYKENDRIRIRIYDANKARVINHIIPKNKIDRITGFTFMEDDEFIVFSGIKNGQSDIYEYYIKRSRINPITNDSWDDADPVFVSGGSRKGIVFLSNRPEPLINIKALPNELPTGNMKAFFYNSTTKRYQLLALTENFEGRIKDVIPYGMDNFAFLSDISGISNRYVVMFGRNAQNMDSAYVIPVTNYNNGILFQQYHPNGQKIIDVVQEKDTLNYFFRPAELPAPWGHLTPKEVTPNTFVENRLDKAYLLKASGGTGDDNVEMQPVRPAASDFFDDNDKFRITAGNDFQTPFNTEEQYNIARQEQQEAEKFAEQLNIKNNPAEQAGSARPTFYDPVRRAYISDTSVIYVDSTFITMRSNAARSSVKIDYLGLNLDNSVLFNKYQSYFHNMGQYPNPGLAFLVVGGLYDQFENHRFIGGIRIPPSLRGLSYFGRYENLTRRTDWGFSYFSSKNISGYNFIINSNMPLEVQGNSTSHFLQFDFSRPLDKVSTIKGNISYRQNQMTLKATEFYSLILPTIKDHWTNLHLEYMYDNTKMPLFNIWNGLRLKIFGDLMYKLNDNNEYYTLHGYEYRKTSYIANLGFDIRYYKPLFRTSILAIRGSGAHAFGSQQIIYYLGGMDNEMSPQWSRGMMPTEYQNYAYQALVTNMRGYNQNVLNGNTYALLNTEIRVPVVSTIFNRTTNSSILKNLQLVGFLDVGSAWEGLLASRERNTKRAASFYWPQRPNTPVVTVQVAAENQDLIAVGYGLGVRTKLLGYFLKFDAAMNLDRNFKYHISIGTDF